MNWRVVIRPEVERDVNEAASWYESKQTGLGAEFVEEVIQVCQLALQKRETTVSRLKRWSRQ
jgi:hypothetical protein